MSFQDHMQFPPSSTLSSTPRSSAVSELPVEIIAQIFLFVNPTYKLFQPPSPEVPPLQLCHVCRDWREIAFGVPQLWNGLYLSHGGLSKFNKVFGPVHEWLGRAINQPLSFRFEFEWTTTTQNHDPSSGITFPADTCSLMHSLILEETENCGVHGIMRIARQLKKAKALRRVCLLRRRWELGFPHMMFPFGWSQLTHLYLPYALDYLTEWKDLLFTCVNLEQGLFEIETTPLQSWNISTPLRRCLPHLREIALETAFLENPNIFHGIRLPALKTLRISSTRGYPMRRLIPGGAGPLPIQLQSIQSLSLISGENSIFTEDIHQLLRDTPAVTELDLQLPPSDIAEVLANSVPHSPLRTGPLPQLLILKLELRHINVSSSGPLYYGLLDILKRFVRSRFEGSDIHIRLKRVVLFCFQGQRGHLADALVVLKAFVEDGLEVEVKIMGTEEKVHWSTRLYPQTIEWPEGLAVAGSFN